jgi:hypothetical protein
LPQKGITLKIRGFAMNKIFQLLICFIVFSKLGMAYVVIPQFADGRFDDGSFYRSSVIVHNNGTISSAICTLTLYGLPQQRLTRADGTTVVPTNNQLAFSVPSNSFQILQSAGTGTIASGYTVVTCGGFPEDLNIFGLFTFYNAAGAKISEATVFSSPDEFGANAQVKTLVVDQREGSRLGVAIANSETSGSRIGQYKITVRDIAGRFVGQAVVTLPPRTNTAKFLDELPGISLPENFVGSATILPTAGYAGPAAYAIGLRYTGRAFTTVPAGICFGSTVCP